MAKSPKSHLLEELRAKAESVSAKRVEQQQLSREVVERVDRRLHAVFQYFDEACKLLQIIAPAIERDFTLPQIVRYTGRTFDRGAVMFRKQRVQQHDVFAHVVIYYTLTGPPPPPVRAGTSATPAISTIKPTCWRFGFVFMLVLFLGAIRESSSGAKAQFRDFLCRS